MIRNKVKMQMQNMIGNPIVSNYIERRVGRSEKGDSTKSLGCILYRPEMGSTNDTEQTKQASHLEPNSNMKNMLKNMKKSSFSSRNNPDKPTKGGTKKVFRRMALKGTQNWLL